MAVSVTYQGKVSVAETLATNVPAVSTPVLNHTAFDTSLTKNASSTPAVTKVAVFEQALTAGAATIDLTSLTGTNGAAVDGTGLKVQFFKFKAKSTNAGALTITTGASNGYTLVVAVLPAGGEVMGYVPEGPADIGPSAKDLDLSGTGTDAVECTIVMG